jgi:hypothetical protein
METLNFWFCLLSVQHFPFKNHAVILGKKKIYILTFFSIDNTQCPEFGCIFI